MKTNLNMPMEECVLWTTRHLARFREGGVWIVPRVLSAYRIEHSKTTATLLLGPGDPPTETVLQEMGWTIAKETKT